MTQFKTNDGKIIELAKKTGNFPPRGERWIEIDGKLASKPRPRKEKPVLSRQQKNAQRASANLAIWERKLKYAQNKVKKYRKQATRYAKIVVLP